MNEEQVIAREAKDLRGELVLRLEGASSSRELSAFQVHLKDEIIRAEERRKGDRHNVDLKNHIRRLRLLGDSLAWKLLHAHAIRNLSKNDGPSAGAL